MLFFISYKSYLYRTWENPNQLIWVFYVKFHSICTFCEQFVTKLYMSAKQYL